MTVLETLVLASTSPRRRQLLRLIGLEHEIVPADIDESPKLGESATDFTLRAACDKALHVAGLTPSRMVLGSDTVVEIDGDILGKPASDREAEEMLGRLSGETHRVHTAMALARDDRCEQLLDTAEVRFQPLDLPTIRWYVATGEPSDKAGAYAIQGIGGLLVLAIQGSPNTVVGLPIHRLAELFERYDIDLWARLDPLRGLR